MGLLGPLRVRVHCSQAALWDRLGPPHSHRCARQKGWPGTVGYVQGPPGYWHVVGWECWRGSMVLVSNNAKVQQSGEQRKMGSAGGATLRCAWGDSKQLLRPRNPNVCVGLATSVRSASPQAPSWGPTHSSALLHCSSGAPRGRHIFDIRHPGNQRQISRTGRAQNTRDDVENYCPGQHRANMPLVRCRERESCVCIALCYYRTRSRVASTCIPCPTQRMARPLLSRVVVTAKSL